MRKLIPCHFLLVLVACLFDTDAKATHLRAGDITLVRQSCSNYRYTITLHVYTKWSAPVKFGGGTLNYGDGSTPFTTPTIDNPPKIADTDDGGVGEVIFQKDHTFPGPGVYLVTYYEQNRNEGILNIGNSIDTPFFIQTQIVIDPLIGCDNTPELLVPPIDQGCTGVKWTHNPGAFDPDGDSLSYELFVPKQQKDLDVSGYQDPNAATYYSSVGIPFSQANEAANGPPTFSIDAVTGTITWDAPGEQGEYNIAFKIISWRKLTDVTGKAYWVSLGYVERDMQIVIKQCKNERPKLMPPPDLCVLSGTLINQDIFATDPDGSPVGGAKATGDSVKIEAFSEVFSLLPTPGYNPSPAKISPGTAVPDSPVWQPVFDPSQQATIHFSWQPSCRDVKEQPYLIVFKATDNGAPPGTFNGVSTGTAPPLATFATWRIRVVAPPPLWTSAVLNATNKSAQLTWQSYVASCGGVPSTSLMQIWRRVDSYPFTPSTCVTGMPDDLGYTMIATVPISNTTYIDNSLATGAKYCYRLVAQFPLPDGGESYVSQEICVGPIIAYAPVITNVTVDVTSETAGQITVKWRSPFEANQGNFPKPYTYEVFRGLGPSGPVNRNPINPGRISDSVFVDTGLNTLQNSYNYKIRVYANNNSFDSSAVASSVRLSLRPFSQQIELTWSANVPWSNNTPEYPRHLIYRSTSGGATISDLTLYDSVNVNTQQFIYLDSGKNNVPLDKNTNYCYAVMTRGSYGNPKIATPLINFSEITCTQPDDQTKPCKPVLSVVGPNCADLSFCPTDGHTDSSPVSNTIRWNKPADATCLKDIQGYYVYAASEVGQTFIKISDIVTDTFYVDPKLSSYARCYKVSSINRAGTESELSDSFCFDNCPYYELPNVLTPNGDNCNDLFSAYSVRKVKGESGGHFSTSCAALTDDYVATLKEKCARYVLSVDFSVYNRWGKEVYHYTGSYNSPGETSGIFIDWNGKDSSGRDLDAATYYFVANVVFDVVDPKKRNKTIKGWLSILR